MSKKAHQNTSPSEQQEQLAQNDSSIEKFDNSLEAIRSRHSQELVIGLCGAIGAGVKTLSAALISELKSANYHVEHIRLSDLISQFCLETDEVEKLKLDRYKYYETLQDWGDRLRGKSVTRVADIGIRRIQHIRYSMFGGKVDGKIVKVTERVAYVVDQIKHHKEVELFQEVYRKNFYMIGLLRTQKEREDNLKAEGIGSPQDILKLIERDRKSDDEHGQHVEKSIQKADYFIRNLDAQDKLSASIKRFINLIHGVGNITPTRDEKGLYAAYSASLGSACLSRQVGAAIMDKSGQIVATGCNDVPKFRGGLYDAESDPDNRCYNRGECKNDKHKSMLRDEILGILQSEGIKNAQDIADRIFNNSKAKSLIEYSRAIHAEMDAIVSLARQPNSSTVGNTLYCTTYPCHNCARHIVAAGIERVIYIEPYEKSLALDLHSDAICHMDNGSKDKLLLQNFEGASPSRYAEFFIYGEPRKDADGDVKNYTLPLSKQVNPHQLDCYTLYEASVTTFADEALGEDKYQPKPETE